MAGMIGGARILCGGVLMACVAIVVAAAPASADVARFEVAEYRHDAGVSVARAEENLEVQAVGARGNVVDRLEEDLGGQYSGVWFDNSTAEFVVPLPSGVSQALVGTDLADVGLAASDFRTVSVTATWGALETARDQIDRQLGALFDEGLVRTSLDPRANAVVITQGEGISHSQGARIQTLADQAVVPVDIRQADTETVEINLEGCTSFPVACDTPMRGGVAIGFYPKLSESFCTAAYKAINKTTGARYVLTAGHCVPNTTEFQSYTSSGSAKYLGQRGAWSYPVHDYAQIGVNGTYWDTSPWPSEVAYMGHKTEEGGVTPVVDPDNAITGEGHSFKGEYVCHTGKESGSSCGFVSEVGMNVPTNEGEVLNMTQFGKDCAIPGDSGGPIFAGHTALGIFTGSDPIENESEFCKKTSYYTEITEDTAALGVTVAPIAPRVTISTTPLNGNPGWVTMEGSVTSPGATFNNKQLEIKMFKWNTGSSSWELKATLGTTVNNNAYKIENWNGVGPGGWLAKAVLPAQEGWAESASEEVSEGHFEIKDGYRIVAKHSGRCLDVREGSKENGAVLHQWERLNPAVIQNQVFTLVPEGGSYYQLVARHSGRCVDVTNASQSDGAPLQQWSCNGLTQQKWHAIPAGAENGTNYVNFVAKHSGKCMDVTGAGTGNGTPVQQWTCNGGPQQTWSFQSVESAPIPTETFSTVSQTLNGEPGWVTVTGNVYAGAYTFDGYAVNVNYEKWENNQWVYKNTDRQTISAATYYHSDNWKVGVGKWRVRGVFEQQGNRAGSASGYHEFEIRKGYQLVNVYSNKCLDVSGGSQANGAYVQQWDCLSPGTHLNQVFTLVPQGGGYYQLVAKHSGKCMDVIGASTSNGTHVQQYECLGSNQANQIFLGVPTGGYTQFRAKHSGKCLEIGGPSTANGAPAQQWDCVGESQKNQLWYFYSVNY